MTVLLHPVDVAPDSPVGGKARSLASLAQARLPIPNWFVVLPEAFELSLSAAGRRQLSEAQGADDGAAVLADLHPAPVVAKEIEAAYETLCPRGEPVAVRSSAADEDSAELSFAGQLESFLFVSRDDLLRRIAEPLGRTIDADVSGPASVVPPPHVPSGNRVPKQ